MRLSESKRIATSTGTSQRSGKIRIKRFLKVNHQSVCACVPYPAGWFSRVFREAEQQVENRPTMLQNALSNSE